MNIREMTIEEIKSWLGTAKGQEIFLKLEELKQDKRKGVQRLVKKWQAEQERLTKLKERWIEMSRVEQLLRDEGYVYIAGVDEVGRGPLAGPVVAAAVILPAEFILLGLDDSKRLSAGERAAFASKIKEEAICYSIASVSAQQIDQVNIYQATKMAMLEAVKQLPIQPEYLLIDALRLDIALPQQAMIKGDAHSVSIASASILAKVHRDTYMQKMALAYPQYGFERNMGYPTKEHVKAIEQYGPTPLHRLSFLKNFSWELMAK